MSSRLREWRVANDLTMPEVGGLTGVSVAMLSRLERGLRRASPRLKVQMARRLGVPIPDLFEVKPLLEEDDDAKKPVA